MAELPDIKIDKPDIDLKKFSLKSIPVWVYVAGGAGLLVLVYVVVKNQSGSSATTVADSVEETDVMSDTIASQLDALQSSIDALNDSLGGQISDVRDEVFARIDELTTEVTTLKQFRASAEMLFDQLQTSVYNVTQRVTLLEQARTAIDRSIATLTAAGEVQGSKINELFARSTETTTNISALQQLASGFESGIQTLKDATSSIRSDLAGLSSAIADAIRQVTALRAKVDTQTGDISALQSANTALRSIVNTLQSQVEALQQTGTGTGTGGGTAVDQALQVTAAANFAFARATGAPWGGAIVGQPNPVRTYTDLQIWQNIDNIAMDNVVKSFIKSLKWSGSYWYK